MESHVPADFIDVDELKAGRAAHYDVLYLPHCYALDAPTATAIRLFVEAGGTVWADGLLGWKLPYGDLVSKVPLEMTSLFGFEFHDIDAMEQPFSLAGKADRGGELCRVCLNLQGADVMLRDSGGMPVATRHRFGKGAAYYYATASRWGISVVLKRKCGAGSCRPLWSGMPCCR